MAREKKTYKKKREEIPFSIQNDDQTLTDFTLRELDGTQRDSYMKMLGEKMKFQDGKPIPRDFTGMFADLLQLCVYDQNNQLVRRDDIQTWPSTALEDLYKDAVELNGLDQEAKKKIEEEAKND